MPWVWPPHSVEADSSPIQGKLSAVLEAARRATNGQAGGSGPALPAVLESADRSDPARILEQIPITAGADLSFPPVAQFHEGRAVSRLPGLFWPVPPPARTAVLMTGFQEERGVRIFDPKDKVRLRRFHPDALAGPISALRSLAEHPDARAVLSPSVSHSVLVLLGLRQAGVSEEARDLLWRAFGVPLFAQLLSPGRNLMAWECEAREGFHVVETNAIFELVSSGGVPELVVTSLVDSARPVLRAATGLTARFERSKCGCGRCDLRLVNLRPRSVQPKALAAAVRRAV